MNARRYRRPPTHGGRASSSVGCEVRKAAHLGRLPRMGDFIQANAGSVLTAVVALLASAVGVWSAEGGIRRRRLRRIKEQLEVLALMHERDFLPERRPRLVTRLEKELDDFLLTARQRWWQRLERFAIVYSVACVIFVVVDTGRAIATDQPLSGLSTAIVGVLLVAVAVLGAALVIVALVYGGYTLLRRARVRHEERRVSGLAQRISNLEDQNAAS